LLALLEDLRPQLQALSEAELYAILQQGGAMRKLRKHFGDGSPLSVIKDLQENEGAGIEEILRAAIVEAEEAEIDATLTTSDGVMDEFEDELDFGGGLLTLASRDALRVVDYHTLYRETRAKWEEQPAEHIASHLASRSDLVVGDFGCGECLLAAALPNHKVISFDYVAVNDTVIEGDMAHTPLVVFDGTSLMRSPFAVRSWWLSLRRENLHAQPKSVPHRTHQRRARHPAQASRRPHRSSLGGGAGKDRAFGRRRDLQQGDRPEALHQPSNGLQMAQAVLRGGVRWTGGSTTLGQAADLSPLR
jgi:hypothetical protein